MTAARDQQSSERIPKVEIRFLNKRDFLDYFLPDVGIGGFHWAGPPGKISDSVSGRVHFRLAFVGTSKKYEMDGKVVWRHSRPPMRPQLPPGVGIEFLPASRKALKELLTFVASKDEDEVLKSVDDRKENRIRVSLRCEYLFKRKLVRERLSNISSTGLYIETDRILEEGERFLFFLHDKQFLRPMVMEGRVVWANRRGERPGIGVQLLFDSRKHKGDVQRYVNSLSEVLDEQS